jgi:hypothetical protein
MDTLYDILTLTSDISWTMVYLAIIYLGFKDKTYGMLFFALALNITWEFIFSFLLGGEFSLQLVINIIWFFFDVVILYTYFRYGRKEFPKTVDEKWFVPWSVLAIAVGFITQYSTALEFPGLPGAMYSAFVINLVMSVLFIGMLLRRDSVEGQSIVVAVFKWMGTAAPTILFYLVSGSNLVLVLGVVIFMFDVIYIGMLYQRFRDLGLNPIAREPVH